MKVTENVYLLECTRHSHAYLILDKEAILIDTGMPGFAKQILKELGCIGVLPQSVQAILLTHHDVDHIGNAKSLTEATHASLFTSAEDIPYITGEKNRPGIKRVIQTLMKPLKHSVNSIEVNQLFRDIRAISTPGHTPGHTIFQYRNVLFTGDLFRVSRGKFGLIPAFMTWDVEELKKSIALLKTLEFEWLCPAHGEPVQNTPAFQEFLKQF